MELHVSMHFVMSSVCVGDTGDDDDDDDDDGKSVCTGDTGDDDGKSVCV